MIGYLLLDLAIGIFVGLVIGWITFGKPKALKESESLVTTYGTKNRTINSVNQEKVEQVDPDKVNHEVWEPKKGEPYFFASIFGFDARVQEYDDGFYDKLNEEIGNCFKTKEEALAFANKLKKQMKKWVREEKRKWEQTF